MLIAGVELWSRSSMESAISTLAAAGIRAFLLPGSILSEPEKLATLAKAARRIVAEAGLGEALLALGGGGPVPAFGQAYCPRALYPLGLAALRSKPAARRSGAFFARALAACGIDLAVGLRLDLANDPKDPLGVLDRFGDEAEEAAALAAAYIKGMSSAGASACVGRFPGLGTVHPSEGEGKAIVDLTATRIEAVEMRPFEQAVRAGAAAVLVGRALVPALEPERIPAARSADVIEGKLRGGLGFKGLVVGDDIGLEAEPGEAAVLDALAGADLSLAIRGEDALAAAAALEEAMSNGRISAARVAAAGKRLDRFLAARMPRKAKAMTEEDEGLFGQLERDREESLTVLRGSLAPMPGTGRRLVLVFLPPPENPEAAEIRGAEEALLAGLPNDECVFSPADPGPRDMRELGEVLALRKEEGGLHAAAVVLSFDAHLRPAQEALARLVEESVGDFCLVAMRDPYDVAFFPRARGLAAAYGFSSGGALAAARLLSGRGTPRGVRPVQIVDL